VVTRYVTDADRKGWLSVVPDGVAPSLAAADPTRQLALPQMLKVDVYKTEAGREFFKVLEGPNMGKKASVKLEIPGRSFLATSASIGGGARLRLNRKLQQIWFGGRGPFSAFTQASNPVPIGSWNIEIPDAPHDAPTLYGNYSPYYRTWFRVLVSASSDRYVHLGVISHGCVTARPWLTERTDPRVGGRSEDELGLPIPPAVGPKLPPTPWTDLYNYLIRSRQDDKTVGTVVVSDL
jgi:hypothetical protein